MTIHGGEAATSAGDLQFLNAPSPRRGQSATIPFCREANPPQDTFATVHTGGTNGSNFEANLVDFDADSAGDSDDDDAFVTYMV